MSDDDWHLSKITDSNNLVTELDSVIYSPIIINSIIIIITQSHQGHRTCDFRDINPLKGFKIISC